MKTYILAFIFGVLVGAAIFYLSLKNYAPIESGRANCYTDGNYKIRLNAELNFPKSPVNPTGDVKDYGATLGQNFYMLSLNRWRPCDPAEFRITAKPAEYIWEFPGVSEEENYKRFPN